MFGQPESKHHLKQRGTKYFTKPSDQGSGSDHVHTPLWGSLAILGRKPVPHHGKGGLFQLSFYLFLSFLSFLSYLSLYFIIFSYLLLSCPILSYLFHPLSRSCSLSIFPDPLLRLHPGPSQLRARVRRGERLHQEAAGARPLREAHSGQGLTTPLADRQQGTF